MAILPFYRESGGGPAVVCLHANASSSRQWLPLMEYLAPRYHVLAADLYGAGKSPAWAEERPLTLRDELTLLEPVFARARGPVTIVAHSYGAAVALIAALEHPERVHALAVSGCLEQEQRYGLSGFSRECLATTDGWSEHWVNDRVYPRRPFVYQPKALQIDGLLSTQLPQYFSRVRIEPGS